MAQKRGRSLIASWFPWKALIRYLARSHGFLDPIAILGALKRFAKPSEVTEPMELLRAGALFHARGLINRKVIQGNLDWIWPYWVRRQFDPADTAFLPRAFSITHVNLTNRNWTAVGIPGCTALPIVDPRGLLTPFWDAWSLDAMVLAEQGESLLPSRSDRSRQSLLIEPGRLAVRTETDGGDTGLTAEAWVVSDGGRPRCILSCEASGPGDCWLAVSLRPFNPEGVSFVHAIELDRDRRCWVVDGAGRVLFDRLPDRHVAAAYEDGDAVTEWQSRPPADRTRCRAGMATALALFRIPRGEPARVRLAVPLRGDRSAKPLLPAGRPGTWESAAAGGCTLDIADEQLGFLYRAAVRSLILHCPRDVYPGPYTYKRFWFRDAAYILYAMLRIGLHERVGAAVARFPGRQNIDGYFHSQEGEWDSNGQVLWLLNQYRLITGAGLPDGFRTAVIKGGTWILRKRCRAPKTLHHGLLPAGFSAEHLGNNDFYYWDDFWAVAGLEAAAATCRAWGDGEHEQLFAAGAAEMRERIERSIRGSACYRKTGCIPASPYRRMDAGAIGSIAASYPLGLYPPGRDDLVCTIRRLREQCCIDGAFFQDMIHSGLNAYLTLQIAQAMLREGLAGFEEPLGAAAALASPTGQWPEAVHPATGGGCMGDGQHMWASAEWVLITANMLMRTEGDCLLLCSGLTPGWLPAGGDIAFGPAWTKHGKMTLHISRNAAKIAVSWEADWHGAAPPLRIGIPGADPVTVDPGVSRIDIPVPGSWT